MNLYPFLLEIVPSGQKPMRLDQFVAVRHGHSRSAINQLCKTNLLLVNDLSAKPAQRIKAGDRIDLLKPYAEFGQNAKPADIPLDIVFEDDHLIVINKPQGMAVHTGLGDHGNTLCNALLFHWSGKINPFLVHRLDKHTSGLIVVAKEGSGAENLANDFAERRAGRIYSALVWGHPKKAKATIESFIGRNPKRQESIEVSKDMSFGKKAITHYEVLEKYGPASLLSLRLETGRTHQIRIHMADLGHALLGDRRYPIKDASYDPFRDGIETMISGQSLHAKELNFEHPVLGKQMNFKADLPKTFDSVTKYLNINI